MLLPTDSRGEPTFKRTMRSIIKLGLGGLGAVLLFLACSQSAPAPDPALLRKPLDDLTLEDMERLGVGVETNFGNFRIRFFPREAPGTVKNFIKLTKMGFYNGLKIDKVVPRYNIQGGDPKGNGTGGPGWTIPAEINAHGHVRGAVGMVHPPKYPNDAGSQFYVMVVSDHHLDKNYTVFGEVWQGLDTVDRITGLPLKADPGQAGPPRLQVLMSKVWLELLPPSAQR
jgi:peptidyl-prolyl cis-trans isomerase B (cyclophilin B)